MIIAHVHHGIRYSISLNGKCSWHTCTHNVYNSFDVPEQLIDDADEDGPTQVFIDGPNFGTINM